MRNLKRVLSLALALVMVLGMMVITTSAADFSDADEITYTEAMDVMAGLGVFKGNPDGTVAPTQVLTRKDAAVIIARIILGEKMAEGLAPTKQIFDDVPTTEWYAAEVEYCNNINMIVGHDGKFNPDGELTGTEFAKLLLCAMGYDADAQGYVGENWDANINADALRNKLNIAGVKLTDKLTREGAAQMLFQALEANMYEYEKSYDKATGAPVLIGPNKVTEGPFWNPEEVLFMDEYFDDLTKIKGVIDGVDLYWGNASFDGTEVRGCGADYKDIGYAGYVWALEGETETYEYLTAISDVIITGTSMGINTNGAAITDLTYNKHPDYIGYIDETGCAVYYNGEFLGNIALDDDYNIVYSTETEDAASVAAIKDVLGYVEKNGNVYYNGTVGAKIEFIDNDNKGKAEAIVINEYKFAQVDRVVKQSKSGEVSVKYYHLDDGTRINPSELVGVTELAMNDYITYIDYGKESYPYDGNGFDYYLVNVLDVAEGEFEDIKRNKLDNAWIYSYKIDGEYYTKSDLSNKHSYLAYGNINKDVEFVLDQYGYVVYAGEPKADPSDYLYVFDNEHDSVLTGLAETMVAYVDGSVEIVDVKKDVFDSQLKNRVFTFEVKNGAYVLDNAYYVNMTDVDYEKYTVSMKGTVPLTETTSETYTIRDLTNTTIVDLRDVKAGKAEDGTLYVGYTEIPDMLDAQILYIPEIDLGFLVAGKAPSAAADLSASFVVFNTETTVVDVINVGTAAAPKYENTYTLVAGVLVKGELVENYVLSAYQKAMIDTYGVGAYKWDKNGDLAGYTSFAEKTVNWTPESNGTVIIDGVDVTAAGTFNDIIILNIEYGYVDEWDRYVLPGNYYSYVDGKILYIVGDGVENSWILADAGAAGTGAVWGKNEYWAEAGYVTSYAPAPVVEAATYTVNSVLKFAEGTTASVAGSGEYIAVKNAATGAIVEYAAVKDGIASFTMPGFDVVTENGYYNYFLNGVEKFTDEVGFQGKAAWTSLDKLAGTVAADTFVKVEWTDKGVVKTATFDADEIDETPIDVVNYDEYITTNWVSVTGVPGYDYVQINDEITVVNNYYAKYAVDLTITGADIATARLNVGETETIVAKGNVVVNVVPVMGAASVAAGIVTVNTSTDLTNAVADTSVNTIVLGSGEFDITLGTSYMTGKDELTIIGNGYTTVAFNGQNTTMMNVKNLTIEGCNILKNEWPKRFAHLNFAGNGSGCTFTVKNCTFEGVGTQGIYINGTAGFKYVITDCTFIGDFGKEGAITIENKPGEYEVVVKGCTFTDIPATSHEIFVHFAHDDFTLDAAGVNVYWKTNP